VEDSVEIEEVFSEFDHQDGGAVGSGIKTEEGAVKLIFPLYNQDGEVGEQWPWNVCGGLIGGPRGNRFCTKPVGDSRYPHCGVASHAAHKADLQKGYGCIPSVKDRSNTESAFLSPTLSGWRFPNSINDLANQALSHEEWVAFLSYLPTNEVMEASKDVEVELAAEALEKSKLLVSFAITPARKKPKLPFMVSKIMQDKDAKNLESRFAEEDDPMDKMGLLSFKDLEAPTSSQDGSTTETNSSKLFSPSVAQWNSLVNRVETLTSELETTREALTAVADASEDRFIVIDRQVINLRGSIGSRPAGAGPSLPALDLWSNVVNLSSKMSDNRDALEHPRPSKYEVMTRKMSDTSQQELKKQGLMLERMRTTKAEYMGQVRPLEAFVEDVSEDLYSPLGTYNKALMSSYNQNPGGSSESPALRTQVESLVSQVKDLTGADLGGRAVDVNDPAITSLKADVSRLLSDNQTIKASLGGEIVRINQESFHSAQEMREWVVDNAGQGSGAYKFFFDVTSMLESLQDSGRSSDETLDSQAAARKANHRSVSASRMLNSFGILVPQIMNKKNNETAFSQVPSYDKWKSNDGLTGLVETIYKKLELWESRTEGLLANRSSTDATSSVLQLGQSLMSKSMAFWVSLCNWIDKFYTKLISKTEFQRPGGNSSLAERRECDSTLASVKEEAWKLVLNVLNDIFQELALRRAGGQAASEMSDDPAMQSAIVLYSTLKAHKFMAELVERKFERHPVMAPTFNGFLFSERASHGDVKRLEIKLGELTTLARNLQSKFDKK
jgi:hypothetical protein